VCGPCVASRHHRRGSPFFGGPDRWRINNRGRRVGVTPHAGTALAAELIVEPPPGPIVAPGATGLIGGLPMRQIVRHHAPRAAAAQHILAAIEHLPQGVCAGTPPGLGRRQEGLQDLPLLIGQVSRVGQTLGGHGRFSLLLQGGSCAEVTQRPLYNFLNSL
jgi:hypothetical protein